jgi:hypothetical protein
MPTPTPTPCHHHPCLQIVALFNTTQGEWSPEEDARLKQLQAERGNKWKEIGQLLGRHQESVNDRWSTLGKGMRAKSGQWGVMWLQSVPTSFVLPSGS